MAFVVMMFKDPPPVDEMVNVVAPEEILILLPATKLLNCKSTPTFCAKIPLPPPIFEAVFASPPPEPGN